MNEKLKYTKQTEEFVKSLNTKQFNEFSDIFHSVYSDNDFLKIQRFFSTKNISFAPHDTIYNDASLKLWVNNFYKEEISKVNLIIRSDEIMNKLNGLKILVSGPTGTGKTSLIKRIIEINKDIHFEDIEFTNLISSKMGQTQINLMMTAHRLNELNRKTIVFIDEIDSIITNRLNSDLGEHSRIVATFLKFLDKLDSKIIIIMATNFRDSIDSAILRRMSLEILTTYLDFDKFIDILLKEEIPITTQSANFLKKNIIEKENNFSFSDVSSFLNHLYIENTMNINGVKPWLLIAKEFCNKFTLNKEDLSERKIRELGL